MHALQRKPNETVQDKKIHFKKRNMSRKKANLKTRNPKNINIFSSKL